MKKSLRGWPYFLVAWLLVVTLPLDDTGAVELELLLAVDASPSVNAAEFKLQMAGYAAAFRHPEMLRAIESIGEAGMAVSVVLWGGANDHLTAVGWTLIRDRASARDFANTLERVPRALATNGTAIGAALSYSISQLRANGINGRRMVIDVSGDGRSNAGHQPALGRDRAIAAGITVNGLTILNDEGGLDLYYRWNVVGGPQSFVEIADDYDDFEDAILRKLIREIRGAPSVWHEPGDHDIDVAMD